MQNITLRKQAERELVIAKEAAEAASQTKSAFLAAMSHEIRTPLNGVLGMAQAMAAEPLSPEQRKKLDVIRQSGEGLLTILNDILDLSKIEAGKLTLEEAEFSLGALVDSIKSAFAPTAAQTGVELRCRIQDDARGVYLGDSTRVRQIFYNLVSNALKFTEIGEVAVDVTLAQSGIELRFADSGVGIPADRLDRLFQKFEQADASTTRRFGGTGLGLAICRELAEAMGGTICAESVEGVGATFTVWLPLARLRDEKMEAVGGTAANAEPTDCSGLRVLAAEDNTVNQLVLKTLLNQAGIDPFIVSDGSEAVNAWVDREWDVILMDVQMPILDGPGATRAIRELEGKKNRRRTPIVALTANAMSHQVDAYLQAGMDAFVAKPIQVERLFEILASVLEDREGDERGVAVG